MEHTYNPSLSEKAMQELWESQKTYAAPTHAERLFSIDTPPPTVSGSLHIGHVFSYTQTDIIARFKRMDGFSVFYPFGFDDNGLATERFVEKKCNVSAFQLGRSAFIELCLKETVEAEQLFENLWRRMGLSIDWSKCYSTISPQARRISQKSFIDLFKKGVVYRKDEPALYCPTCRTSVAQAELDDQDKSSTFNNIIFKSSDGKDLVIATTRPEFLPACVAVFYNPRDTRYQHLKGSFAEVPLFGLKVPFIEDERVLLDKGTGLVMCCTYGDKTDIEWHKAYNLTPRPILGRDGKMTEAAGMLAGKKVAEARVLVLEALKEAGLVRSQEPITRPVNIHERCKQEIEYLALTQWFLKILPYKKEFIAQGDKIEWHPSFMKSRYINWVEHLSWDWCLSRQRYFGIPFPVWYCKDCKEVILAEEKSLPVDPQETQPKQCTKCSSTNIEPDTDVMDTWNTSSLTPYITRELYGSEKGFLPMSMRPQAHDIIRTWAFYTIVKAWMHDNTIPWNDIVISGHVLTGEGQKISKSQANSPLIPENLLKLYPADVVRYWTASATLGTDVAFSENQLKIGQRLLVKLWNAFKFIREHTQGLAPEVFTQGIEPVGIVNQWITRQAAKTFAEYKKYMDAYEFSLALQVIERFFWHDFCDNYLELIKDQLFNPTSYPPQEIQETKSVLAKIGLAILQFFAPYMPHITEELYQALYKASVKKSSIHVTHFNDVQIPLENFDHQKAMDWILDITAQVRKLKSDAHVSLKTDLEKLALHAADESTKQEVQRRLQPQEQLLKGIARAKILEYGISVEQSSLKQDGTAWHAFVVIKNS
jgi:valyl-tRNA synthetase